MKISLVILLFIVSGTMWSQKVYTSTTTQFFPSAEMENIDRVITFDDERITIKSITKENKVKIQTLQIKGKVLNFNNNETYFVYECTSRSGRSPITVMVKEEKPDHITLLQPSLRDHNKIEEFKMLLDK